MISTAILKLPFRFDNTACTDYDEVSQSYQPLANSWQQQVRDELIAMPPTQMLVWCELWTHCTHAQGAKPSPSWMKQALALIEQLGVSFSSTMAHWLNLIVHHGQQCSVAWWTEYSGDQHWMRGFIWLASFGDAQQLAMPVAKLVHTCERKYRNHDGKMRKGSDIVSGAGFLVLSKLNHLGILATLWLESQSVHDYKLGILRPFSQEYLDELREQILTNDPFNDQGVWITRFGQDATLTFHQVDIYRPHFVNAKGKNITKEPRKLLRQYGVMWSKTIWQLHAIRNLHARLYEITERALITQRRWIGSNWLALYNNPLLPLQAISRQRIWRIEENSKTRDMRWFNEAWRDINGQVVTPPAPDANIWLWHPALDDFEYAERWRQCLLTHRVSELMHQAWRVIYHPLPEEQASQQSRRFAGYRMLDQFYCWKRVDHSTTGLANTQLFSLPLMTGWEVRMQARGQCFDYLVILHNDQPTTLKNVPPILYSEAIRQVQLTLAEDATFPKPNASVALIGLLPTRQIHIRILWHVLQQTVFASKLRITPEKLYVHGIYHEYSIDLLGNMNGWPEVYIEPSGQRLTGFQPGVFGDEDKIFGVMRRNIELQAMYWPLNHEWTDRIFVKVKMLIHDDQIEWEWVVKQIRPPEPV